MNRLIYYGSVDAIPFYNCSIKSYHEWMATGIRRPWLGWPVLIFGFFIELIYPPIIYIIFKTQLIRHPCYKIMVFLAITDMTATVCSCFVTGYLLIIGAVFCSYPTITYIFGGLTMTTWCMSCSATASLFLNRVVSVAFQGNTVEKKLAYFCILICICYGFYVFVFNPTICFNSEWILWIPEPQTLSVVTPEAAQWYQNSAQFWNNWLIAPCLIILFTLYCVLIKKLARGQKSKAARFIFIQCCIICFLTTVCAIIYNTLSLITPPFWMLILCQVCWSINHACPAIIYLTVNETIKREFRKLFCFGKKVHREAAFTTTSHYLTVTHSFNN